MFRAREGVACNAQACLMRTVRSLTTMAVVVFWLSLQITCWSKKQVKFLANREATGHPSHRVKGTALRTDTNTASAMLV